MTLIINIETTRRFVLGRQGLWPGRRWRGLASVATAALRLIALQGILGSYTTPEAGGKINGS